MEELKISEFMIPGDTILVKPSPSTTPTMSLKVGPGLMLSTQPHTPSSSSSTTTAHEQQQQQHQQQQLIVTRVGLHGHTETRSSSQQQHWIQGHSKRYVAALGDPVIGIIVGKHADGYRVDIGTSQAASLDGLAFEGATKRMKPNLKVGAVVYARVSLALSHTETEIECLNPSNQKSDGFGEVSGGMLIRDLDLTHCKKLLSPPYTILTKIGARQKYEISIGMNGRIWCKSDSVSNTIKILNQIKP